jgi:copper chaperone CopZ
MKEVTLRVENMHCGACVRRVTQALEKVGGVTVDGAYWRRPRTCVR